MKKWRVDLALRDRESLRTAPLPSTSIEEGFQFEVFLEFKFLTDDWKQAEVRRYGEPLKGREAVAIDVAKIARYLQDGVCKTGYVIVFEGCDSEFPPTFAADTEEQTGCRVRFVRG